MAWIDGRWLDDKEREEQYELYHAYYNDVVYPTYGDDPANWSVEAVERWAIYSRLERVRRCKGNLLAFSIEYFSEHGNPGNDGNWDGFRLTKPSDAAEFHRELTGIMDEVATVKRNAKVAAAVSRSHGKSTYLSRAFPLSEILYRNRRYIINISETPTVARANMEWLRNQLKFNHKLREDFGPLLNPRDKSNIVDNGEEFIAWHDDGQGGKRQVALVQAASTGQALRGRNWNGTRPDLVVMDDLEDARPGGNASTPEQRSKLLDWLRQTVMALGDPEGTRTAYVLMGTTVHRESLLMHVLHDRADFQSTIYRAIINEPERMDLWEQCRHIYIDRNNSNRAQEAEQFYLDNKEEMDRGAKVLWEDFQPLWKLMTWRWNNGTKAFNTEYMNNPVEHDSMIFNPEEFTYYHGEVDYLSNKYDVSMGVDPAMGKQRGDYSAIVVTAKDRDTGIIYVVDAYGDRIKPSDFIKIIVEKVLQYQPTVIAAEAVAAQEFIVDEMKKELERVGYPAGTRVKKIYHRTRKELRIEAMLPKIEDGTIQYNRKHALLLEQYELYGTGSHDDVIDAAEMSVSALTEQAPSVTTVRRASRW